MRESENGGFEECEYVSGVVLGEVSLYRVDELIYGRHLFLGLHALRHLFLIAFHEITNFLGYMHEHIWRCNNCIMCIGEGCM
jgi:hypothetical protein